MSSKVRLLIHTKFMNLVHDGATLIDAKAQFTAYLQALLDTCQITPTEYAEYISKFN